MGGELQSLRSYWAGCFWTLAPFFGPMHVFLDLAQGEVIYIETRCMKEIVDAGEVRILKQHKHKKWWTSLRVKQHGWRKLRKWLEEVEMSIGGKGS